MRKNLEALATDLSPSRLRLACRTVASVMALAVLCSGSAFAKKLPGQDTESRLLSDRFQLALGWYGADFNTDASVGFGGLLGTFVRLEDDLSLDANQSSLWMDGSWRFNRRHALNYGFVSLERSGNRVIDEPIDFGGFRFAGNVDSVFNQDLLNIGYQYSFYNNGKIEAAVQAGLSIYRFKLGLAGDAALLDENGEPIIGSEDFVDEEERITAPTPAFGIRLNYAITSKIIFTYSAAGFNFDNSDFEARVNNQIGFVQWFFHRNVSLGGGLNATRVRVSDKSGDTPYRVDYRFAGYNLFFNFVF